MHKKLLFADNISGFILKTRIKMHYYCSEFKGKTKKILYYLVLVDPKSSVVTRLKTLSFTEKTFILWA